MTSRYRLLQPLATGGMAELFLGVAKGAEGFERTVAIKRVLPHLAREPGIASMFVAEARLSMLLQHQNIVTVHDVGEGSEGLFLVMELVDGWDLGAILRAVNRQGLRIPPHLAVFIASQAQAGLQHAYRRQHDGQPVMTAHRDVSPSNLLVSREGEVKVTDFGIARLEGISRTEPGAFKGKVPYAAPEVLQGEPATALSDQFSLGIILSELLAGQHPFGPAAEPVAVAYSILNRAPASLPDVPASLATLVLRMLSRDPTSRFPEPEDVSEALARWLAQTGEPASSHALATFLRGVRLPPSVGELARAAAHEGAQAPSVSFVTSTPAPRQGAEASPGPLAAPVGHREGVAPKGGSGTAAFGSGGAPWKAAGPASVPVSGEEEEPWSPSPGGVALSASGEVVHACALCGSALASSDSPCEACTQGPASSPWSSATETPTSVGIPSAHGRSAASRASPPNVSASSGGDASGHGVPGGGSQGRMTPGAVASAGRPSLGVTSGGAPRGSPSGGGASASGASSSPRVDNAAPSFAAQSLADIDEAAPRNRPSIQQAGSGDLELEERAPRPEGTSWELEPPVSALPRRRGRWGLAVALFTVATVLAGGVVFLWPRYEAQVMNALRGGQTPALTIRSEPSGARVTVDGVDMGVTPLVMDNAYPARSIPVQLKLRGHRTWTGSFMGGMKADVDAQLLR
ncbi:protein kinase domain-containing protein [Corallococcus terminator]|uniref:non-specific serine/threonine protein kinase n=1 Tax=Corallococcus terminator TaxID=2316733 RepID=A0A3A8ILB0_9BACT|nr:protein kinase [Corallococcus terminator]RKG83478.1 PEGA domain-containing protein [Corallococcus terminator]